MNTYRIEKLEDGSRGGIGWEFLVLVDAPSRRKAIVKFFGVKGCPNGYRVRSDR